MAIHLNLADREAWRDLFRKLKVRYTESHGNFVFFDSGHLQQTVAAALAAPGIDIGRAYPPFDTWHAFRSACQKTARSPDGRLSTSCPRLQLAQLPRNEFNRRQVSHVRRTPRLSMWPAAFPRRRIAPKIDRGTDRRKLLSSVEHNQRCSR